MAIGNDTGKLKAFRERLSHVIEHKFQGKHTRLARKAGVAPSTVQSWIDKEAVNPNAFALFKIAKASGVSVEWFLTGEEASGPVQIKALENLPVHIEAFFSDLLNRWDELAPPIQNQISMVLQALRQMVTGYDWVDWVRVPPGAFKPLGVDERRLLEEAVEVLRARGRDVSGYSRMLQASIESLYETVTEMGKPPGVAEPTRLSKMAEPKPPLSEDKKPK